MMTVKPLGATYRHWRITAAFMLFIIGGIVYFSIWLWVVTSRDQILHTWYWPAIATLITSVLGFIAPDKTLGIAADIMKGAGGREDP